jgi:HK97 family phage major capsid protein
VNRSVKEQLKAIAEGKSSFEKQLQVFADKAQMEAYMKEASALTAGGNNQGGRTGMTLCLLLCVWLTHCAACLALWLPMVLAINSVSKLAMLVLHGVTAIQNNGATTTENTSIWQLVLQDLNVQFPIRTAALDDIDGLEANVVDDMLAEFAQAEALSMIQNNDQGATSLPYGGSNGLRGLNQYAGANSTYAGGTTSTAAFGTSGTGSTSGLHSLATYDQLTSNVNTVGAANITYKDVVNFIYALPQQYWTTDAKFMVSPILLAQIRGLTRYQRHSCVRAYVSSETNGIVGRLLGFDVVVNKYLDTPSQTTTGSAGTTSLYPMYFGDWSRFHTIVDRLNMVMRRYDQTQPGFINFFGEKRLATSVRDP